MYRVPQPSISRWEKPSHDFYPTAANVVCGHCGRLCNFSIEGTHVSALVRGGPAHVACPSCRQIVRFWVTDATDSNDPWLGTMWMLPAPRERSRDYSDVLEMGAEFPDALHEEYMTTLQAFDQGLWRPAAQGARIVLEGLARSLIERESGNPPAERATLAELLRILPDSLDLKKPITDVADALRDGGNLASHFNAKGGVDQPFAEEMLDLLDAVIDYLVVLPDRLEMRRQFEKHVGRQPDVVD